LPCWVKGAPPTGCHSDEGFFQVGPGCFGANLTSCFKGDLTLVCGRVRVDMVTRAPCVFPPPFTYQLELSAVPPPTHFGCWEDRVSPPPPPPRFTQDFFPIPQGGIRQGPGCSTFWFRFASMGEHPRCAFPPATPLFFGGLTLH